VNAIAAFKCGIPIPPRDALPLLPATILSSYKSRELSGHAKPEVPNFVSGGLLLIIWPVSDTVK
jgi:hypothetical protein